MSQPASTQTQNKQATLFYIHDPMCSWCWGFKPTLDKFKNRLLAQFDDVVTFKQIVGGLAPDSSEPMPEAMQEHLQGIWRKISLQLGTEFSFRFWTENTPIRNTYQACRAVVIAETHDKQQEMIDAIQQGYYLNAKNPSDVDVLTEFATQIGLDDTKFRAAMHATETESLFQQQLQLSRALGAQGFPSIRLVIGRNAYPIPVSYQDADAMIGSVLIALNQSGITLD